MAVTLVQDEIEAYAAAHTTPLPPLLDELAASSTRGVNDDRAIVAFNDHVAADRRVAQVMLTVRDGVTLIRRV